MQARLEGFLALVKRELDADEVELVGQGAALPDDACWVSAPLPEGLSVAARLAPERELVAAKERLDALASVFYLSLEPANVGDPPRRSELLEALHVELLSLAGEAGARDALVIDAHSPIVWGTTETEATTPRDRLLRSAACFRTVAKLRALPAMEDLPRGGHLSAHETAPGFAYFALSFAAIYVAALVYDGPFEQLRARRALGHALPAIERLLVALPPFDPSPEPIAKAVRARRPR